ncbi:MAG TPA: xanthine dehydrogenase family protein molybdopterin-binding subunit [Stellaceae bacterium]|jgi:carbon-monoxide dehydrogenase large subunit|nr:xanthine dehydrogenase family protein molybdopterin-binding subunit [Stellaceae bacterium]
MNDAIELPDLKSLGAIGQPVRRKEDERLLTGRGRFSDDFSLPRQAHMAVVRSPHPHARIGYIDTARAAAMPGVLGVFTGQDCSADGLKPIPHNPVPQTRYDMKLTGPGGGAIFIGPQMLLPADKVRHVGEAVAVVVADTEAQAQDAAEAVAVEYRELPWVAQITDALAPGAPVVWDEVSDNVLVDTAFGDAVATERAFAAADHVVEMEFHVGRVTGVPMEPRAALGHWDAATGRYTLWAGSGGAVRQKAELATVLGVAPEVVRVLSFDVGGNFGTRNRLYVESALAVWASRRLGRPVKYTSNRSEVFLSDFQGRDLMSRVALAVRADGRFLGLRADNISNVGARCASLSPLGKGSALVTGSYDIAAATLRSRAVFTNTMPTNAYRSSGRPEVTYAIERVVDEAARRLGIDRVELRRMNLIRPQAMPYPNAVGARYDSGTYEDNMDLAMATADWGGFAARRRAAEARGKLLGLGLANYVESSIGAPRERSEITVTPKSRVEVVIGTGPSGQGHETSFAQVVGALLAIPVENIDIVMGDTDVVSLGGGSHSGRSMRHSATLFAKAAPELIAKGRAVVGRLLDTDPDRVRFDNGRFSAPPDNRSFDFLELAREAERLGADGALAVVTDNEMHDPVFPNGCAVCEVEVDPETGMVDIARYSVVDDVGRCINPLIVHGQSHGGIAQGVGEAMWEECAVDPASGQPLAGSFMEYGMPRSDNLPSFAVRIVEVLSPTNPFGIKAGGEGGCTPALAVVISAILDALAPLGVRDLTMPATPLKVWQAIQAARHRAF